MRQDTGPSEEFPTNLEAKYKIPKSIIRIINNKYYYYYSNNSNKYKYKIIVTKRIKREKRNIINRI